MGCTRKPDRSILSRSFTQDFDGIQTQTGAQRFGAAPAIGVSSKKENRMAQSTAEIHRPSHPGAAAVPPTPPPLAQSALRLLTAFLPLTRSPFLSLSPP